IKIKVPTSVLASTMGIRTCLFDELNPNNKINIDNFEPHFKSFLLCDDLPEIISENNSMIRVIPFPSKIVRLGDISEKIECWAPIFMAMLIKYHRKCLEKGIILPKLVIKNTERYQNKYDVYEKFIDDYLEKTNNKN